MAQVFASKSLPRAALYIDHENIRYALKNQQMKMSYPNLFGAISKRFKLEYIGVYLSVANQEVFSRAYERDMRNVDFFLNLTDNFGGWPTPNVVYPQLKYRNFRGILELKNRLWGKLAPNGLNPEYFEEFWCDLIEMKMIQIEAVQKGVDMMMGVEAYREASTKYFNAIILMTQDTDFLQIARLIRKEQLADVVNIVVEPDTAYSLMNECSQRYRIIIGSTGYVNIESMDSEFPSMPATYSKPEK